MRWPGDNDVVTSSERTDGVGADLGNREAAGFEVDLDPQVDAQIDDVADAPNNLVVLRGHRRVDRQDLEVLVANDEQAGFVGSFFGAHDLQLGSVAFDVAAVRSNGPGEPVGVAEERG